MSLATELKGRTLSKESVSTSLVPIGIDSRDCPIWMSLADCCLGAVYAHDEDLGDEFDEPSIDLAEFADRKIADSFSGFLKSLHQGQLQVKPGFVPSDLHRTVLPKA
jgi:hypothetical protein